MSLEPDYTLEEVSKALRVSTRWVRDRLKAYGLEHQRKGHKITFTEAQVAALRATTISAPVEESITTGRKKRSS